MRRRLGAGRLLAVGVVVVTLFAVLVGRLAQVQVVQGPSYAAAAQVVNTRTVVLPAPRGRILDAHGTALADNGTTVVVTVERATLLAQPDDGVALLTRLAGALHRPVEEVVGRSHLCGTEGAPAAPVCWGGSAYVPIPVAEGVDPALALAVAERPEDYPGVSVVTQPVRQYPKPDGAQLAQVLGYLGPPTQPEVTASKGAITSDDLVGRAGLEQQYDAALRGTPGRLVVAVDPRGVVERVVSRVAPVPGDDLVTNLDVVVQAVAERALAARIAHLRSAGGKADSGAVVVLDTRTGGVVASASYPAYDPNVWTGGISSTEYARLTDPRAHTPLVNRVVAATYPPASTFKAISLPAAISAGNDLHGTYPCTSAFRVGDRDFHNFESHAYGQINLQRAIQISCDTIFYRFAYSSWLAQGGLAASDDARDPFVSLARAYGLGQVTGVDLPGEAAGRLLGRDEKLDSWTATRVQTCERAKSGYPDVARADPARATYLKALAVENCTTGFQFRAGDEANFAIGQGETATTPLQMAVTYAAIANGGQLLTPRVGDALVATGGARTPIAAPSRPAVHVDPTVAAYLRTALRSVVTGGTVTGAFRGMPADWPVAGKTGTGEIFGQQDVGWFLSYAPSTKPRYAVAVVVSQGGTGASSAAPVARAVHEVLRTLPAAP